MELVDVQFVKTHEDAVLPKRNHNEILTGDAGYDLFAVEDTLIPARGSNIVPVGLEVAHITPGYWFRIESRSGLSFRHNLEAFNGIIDNGYKGNCSVLVFNRSDVDVCVKRGQACAQFIVYKMVPTRVDWADEKTESSRGEKGFGSSDKNGLGLSKKLSDI